ncbi:MAG: PilZ domain-containing protein [Candidatus Methylomirabilales bacterium]
MGDERPDRRQYPRVSVAGRTKGQVNAVYDVSLLDISLGGALIEHAQVVQPGIIFDLILTLQGCRIQLRCRVVRSTVHRPEVQADGGRKLIYRTGLEFLQPSTEMRQVITSYIQSIIEHENGGPPTAADPLEPLEHGSLHLEGPAGQRAR